MKKERRKQLKQLQKKLSYSFKKISILNHAFIHKSYANENPELGLEDNERFEFLGDADAKQMLHLEQVVSKR